LDAYEFAPKGQKSLILLTFSLWHLNWRLYNTCYASNLDANPKNPEVVRLPGFLIPIFHSAILIDANAKNAVLMGFELK